MKGDLKFAYVEKKTLSLTFPAVSVHSQAAQYILDLDQNLDSDEYV